MITLKYKLEPSEIAGARYVATRTKPWVKYPLLAFISFDVAICIASAWAAALEGRDAVASLVESFPLYSIFYLLLSILMYKMLFAREIFSQEYHVTISSEQLDMTAENGTVTMTTRWSNFEGYRVEKDFILLRYSPLLPDRVFPRRVFASEEEFNTFLSYLRASLGPPKRW